MVKAQKTIAKDVQRPCGPVVGVGAPLFLSPKLTRVELPMGVPWDGWEAPHLLSGWTGQTPPCLSLREEGAKHVGSEHK